ncbi:hypothetical protein R3P38DRAFT_3178812 [Favolaschia claudopus]|uniref:26S proteasome non-ATPase regulatory subunit 3 N-terminal TPR repeats domain-containing protein n=1 Tax=Favolaschia claudopus TaxID=2862362 RepID=A0AAW0CQE6_9AGAR
MQTPNASYPSVPPHAPSTRNGTLYLLLLPSKNPLQSPSPPYPFHPAPPSNTSYAPQNSAFSTPSLRYTEKKTPPAHAKHQTHAGTGPVRGPSRLFARREPPQPPPPPSSHTDNDREDAMSAIGSGSTTVIDTKRTLDLSPVKIVKAPDGLQPPPSLFSRFSPRPIATPPSFARFGVVFPTATTNVDLQTNDDQVLLTSESTHAANVHRASFDSHSLTVSACSDNKAQRQYPAVQTTNGGAAAGWEEGRSTEVGGGVGCAGAASETRERDLGLTVLASIDRTRYPASPPRRPPPDPSYPPSETTARYPTPTRLESNGADAPRRLSSIPLWFAAWKTNKSTAAVWQESCTRRLVYQHLLSTLPSQARLNAQCFASRRSLRQLRFVDLGRKSSKTNTAVSSINASSPPTSQLCHLHHVLLAVHKVTPHAAFLYNTPRRPPPNRVYRLKLNASASNVRVSLVGIYLTRNRILFLAAQRTASLRHDDQTHASLINRLLRSYIHSNLYAQADKLISKTTSLPAASNPQLARYSMRTARSSPQLPLEKQVSGFLHCQEKKVESVVLLYEDSKSPPISSSSKSPLLYFFCQFLILHN